MNSRNDIFKIVATIVRLATNVQTCVIADDVAAAPKGEYCAIRISESVSPTAKGEKIRQVSEDGRSITLITRIPIIYEITLNFYRGSSIASATKMIHCFRLSGVNTLLFRKQLGWAGSEAVQNLTDLQSGAMEERASIVIRLVGSMEQSETVNTILFVPVNVQNENGEIIAESQTKLKVN